MFGDATTVLSKYLSCINCTLPQKCTKSVQFYFDKQLIINTKVYEKEMKPKVCNPVFCQPVAARPARFKFAHFRESVQKMRNDLELNNW